MVSDKLTFENRGDGYLRVLSSEKLNKDIFKVEDSGEIITIYRVRDRERETKNEDGSYTFDSILVPINDEYDTPDWPYNKSDNEEDSENPEMNMYATVLPGKCNNIKVARKIAEFFEHKPFIW